MNKINLAIFLALNGEAEEAISFYQSVFNGELLFKISNREFKKQLNPSIFLEKGTENFISHSIIQIGGIQLQIADNPLYKSMPFSKGTEVSFSVLTDTIPSAKEVYNKATKNSRTRVIQEPIENEFAFFHAIIQDPFGVLIQITNEKEMEAEKKGGKINA